MLHAQTPSWLRTPLTRKLSSIPLQSDRHGLRTVVQFLLGKQQEPSITQLDHIGKVVGSIPSWIFAEVSHPSLVSANSSQEYVQKISTQVLDLLDEKDTLLGKCGVSIISFLVRNHAALVERSILEPIRKPLLPSGTISNEIISTDESIRQCLRRLEVITLNSGQALISSAIRPLVKNLFLLSVYTRESHHSNIKTQVVHLLSSYLASTPSPATDVLDLVEQISVTSNAEGWIYTPGGTGGVAIRRATKGDIHDVGFEEIFTRVATVVEIIGKASDEIKSEIFVGVVRRWLSPRDEDLLLYFSPSEKLMTVHLRTLSCCRKFYQNIRLNYSIHLSTS
jgi:hypothetical protein